MSAKRSLNFKFGSVVAILIIGAVAISVLSLAKLRDLNEAISQMISGNVARTLILKDIRGFSYLQALDVRNIMVEETAAGMQQIHKNIEERNKQFEQMSKDLEALSGEVGKRELADLHEIYKRWWAVNSEIISHALKSENRVAFELAKTQGASLRKELNDHIMSMVERQQKAIDEEDKRTTAEYANARALILLFAGISIFAGIAVAAFVLVSLSRSINKILEDLNGSSEQVSVASQQIASSSEQLSEASTEQASSLEETVATLEELTSMVRLNADHAKEAARLSESTRKIANKGEEEIRTLVSSMGEISKDSKKIEEIITVIDDIAFQTNLLALNAAVEAARAGEQGKGFAVVAEAVRNLAQRSSSAAKDITDLIKGSVEKIENGSAQVSQSGSVLAEIVTSVQKVSDINAEIAAASEEQASGISQIGKAMNQLDQVTQVNAATSEEAAAAAQELSSQATQLTRVVDLLSVVIKGGAEKGLDSFEVLKKKVGTAAPNVLKKIKKNGSEDVIPFETKSEEKSSVNDVVPLRRVGTTDGF